MSRPHGSDVMSGDTITRKRSFAQVPDALVIDHRLSHVAVRLWVRLDKYAGSDGNAFPSRARLAADLGVSKGTIARGLGALAAAGWISRHPRDDRPGGSWQTVLHEETTVPSADPVSHMSRGGLTGETGASHMCDPEGYPPTDNEHDLIRGDATHRPEGDEAKEQSRVNERQLWRDIIGQDHLHVIEAGPWNVGTFTTDAFYDAFRKGAQSLEAKQWPGRYLDCMEDWEDWLLARGVALSAA